MTAELATGEYQALAEFRFQIRRFLHFSEAAAKSFGLEPQQHQMLLTLRALNEENGSTIGSLAEHLMIQHHSAVGLVDRSAAAGLVTRTRATGDRRKVRVKLTPLGAANLERLTGSHRTELRQAGPLLLSALAKAIHHETNK